MRIQIAAERGSDFSVVRRVEARDDINRALLRRGMLIEHRAFYPHKLHRQGQTLGFGC